VANCPNCGAPAAGDARFCASCGTPLSTTQAEERKVATILFADVIGSTDLGEQLDPERLRALLHEYFAAMSRVIEEWAGTVEKYIGDAILAVFGVPTSREDDPVRALRAASDMLAQLDRLNADFEQRHGVRLAIRIGVNTGEVLAPVGGRPGGQFLVSGDPVNVAARLQEAADPGSVLVGERTWAAARNVFMFDEPVSLIVKGKRDPVLARRLGRPTAGDERGVRFQAPMVGRDRELATLLGLLDEAIENEQPRLVLVSGSAGIGKSRLLREFVTASNERHEGLVVLRGRCLAAGHGITFWALGEILRAAAGISLDESSESAIEKLRATVASALEPLGVRHNELDETFYALATSANLAPAGNPLDHVEPESVGEEMARAWPRFLTGLAARAPTAIILEDLHWADERMVGMIASLSARSAGRLMVIGTSRPEFLESHARFAGSGETTVVALRPLTEAQSEMLVTELLGQSDPLQALLMDVRQKADGNPFFLEEILQRLIDEGALVRHEGRWRATERAQSVRLPDTIHALLAARIDALPAPEKALLQQAAVVGRIFWPGSLAAAADGRDPVETLRSLEQRGLVSARTSSTIEGQPEYIFRHVLIRDVAYASVPRARRARAHAETGRWLETLAADRLDEFGELLAYHYAAAAAGDDADLAWATDTDLREGLRRRAVSNLIGAGNAARRRFAVDRAIALHEQALSLATADSEKVGAHEGLGDDHEALFHMDEAVDHYLAAIDLERQAENDSESVGRLGAKVAGVTKRWGAFKGIPPHARIRAIIDESLKRDLSDRVRASLLIGSGMVTKSGPRSSSRTPIASADRAELPQRIADVEGGLMIALRLDDPSLVYRAYEVLSLLYWHVGDIDKYRAVNERESELLDRLPSRRDRVDVLIGICEVRIDEGRYEAALHAAEQAFEQAVELSEHERMHASFNLMWSASEAGHWDRALEVLPWHVEAAEREAAINCPNVRGGAPLGATLLVWRGEVERALQLVPVDESALTRDTMVDRGVIARYAALVGRADLAASISESMVSDPDRLNHPDGFEPLMETLAELGSDAELKSIAAGARSLAGTTVILEPLADRADATLAMRAGDVDEARRRLELALTRFDELGVPFEAARTRGMLAPLVDEPRRSLLLREALDEYDRLGAKPFAQAVRERLGGGANGAVPSTLTGP
jgi:class 3 adenylate cyclase/tetratricopeptide (TPR) repeat protein